MINCVAIDDEPLALELLTTYCSMVDYLDLRRTFTRTSEAADFIKNFPVDLIFLDIQMPDISGIDFYRSKGESKMVIFTTAYSEYGVEGFNLNAVDYLHKPITYQRFEQAVVKTKEYFDYLNSRDQVTNPYLFIRSDYRLCKIAYSDIIYIEGLDDYVKIYTDGARKSITAHMSLKSLCERLPSSLFKRVHRSYIINFSKEISYSSKTIHLENKDIPVGIRYDDKIRMIFNSK